ncbi:hypothetical protein [Nocardia tenerifensis]|nr:hypothetical protein [Nocardia tenerifensis]
MIFPGPIPIIVGEVPIVCGFACARAVLVSRRWAAAFAVSVVRRDRLGY